MSSKRDAAYFKRRLKKDHPSIFSDLQSGKITSVRAAAAQAGLISLPGRVEALKRHWARATAKEQREFVDWVKLRSGRLRRPTPKASATPIANSAGNLTARASSFLAAEIRKRKATPGQIMKVIGFKNYDYRLSHSMRTNKPLPPEILGPLSAWMQKNGFK